jgi:hypothetical protein
LRSKKVRATLQEESGELKDHLPAIVGESKTGLKGGKDPENWQEGY